jgi:hypothetical protein
VVEAEHLAVDAVSGGRQPALPPQHDDFVPGCGHHPRIKPPLGISGLQRVRIHVFTCVLALQIAHLMRLKAARAGLRTSVRELLSQLASIEETVLIYPSTGGRPRARRMTTELTGQQRELHDLFGLQRWAPRT